MNLNKVLSLFAVLICFRFMAHQSKFTIALTKEQKAYIAGLLPPRYSFQIEQEIQKPKHLVKIAPLKKIQLSQDENRAENESTEPKRRKTKVADQLETMERRNSLGRKEEIIKKWNMVKKLKKHEASWPFRNPVNVKALDIPNYHEVIHISMDLYSIEQKLKNDQYQHPSEIERDINQIILNSYKFNQKNQTYYQATRQFEQHYVQLCQEMQEKNKKELPQRNKKKDDFGATFMQPNQKHSEFSQIQKSIFSIIKKMQEVPVKRKEKSSSTCNIRYSRQENSMTTKEKRELAQEIRGIENEQHLAQILRILKKYIKEENCGSQKKDGQNKSMKSFTSIQNADNGLQMQIISVDLEKLDSKGLNELQNYMRVMKHQEHNDIIKEQRDESMYSKSIAPFSQLDLGSENTPIND